MILWIVLLIVIPIMLFVVGCSIADLATGKPYVFINIRQRHRIKQRHANPVPDYDAPIEALKYASLVWDAKYKRLRLTGIGHGRHFPYDGFGAEFVCKRHNHNYPRINDVCGFYALKKHVYENPTAIPEEVMSFLTYVALDVQLWGWIQEHQWGYRAQHQRVLAMHVRTVCRHDGPYGVVVDSRAALGYSSTMTRGASDHLFSAYVTCENCKDNGNIYLSDFQMWIPSGEITGQMGVEVLPDLTREFVQNRFLKESEVN